MKPPGPPTTIAGWWWWAHFAVRTPSRLVMFAMIAAAAVGLYVRRGTTTPGPWFAQAIQAGGGAAILALLVGWRWFWSGRAVVRAWTRWAIRRGLV